MSVWTLTLLKRKQSKYFEIGNDDRFITEEIIKEISEKDENGDEIIKEETEQVLSSSKLALAYNLIIEFLQKHFLLSMDFESQKNAEKEKSVMKVRFDRKNKKAFGQILVTVPDKLAPKLLSYVNMYARIEKA